jgi:hypothetical protein
MSLTALVYCLGVTKSSLVIFVVQLLGGERLTVVVGFRYMQRDLEGGVADTRRGVTCELVNSMCVHFELPTAQMCLAQCEALLARSDWQASGCANFSFLLCMDGICIARVSFEESSSERKVVIYSRRTKRSTSSSLLQSKRRPRCPYPALLASVAQAHGLPQPAVLDSSEICGVRQSGGVIETNPHVDVMQFFQRHVLTDLQVS